VAACGSPTIGGVGRRLLHTAVETIRASGAPTVFLESTVNAQAFYARHGFVEIGRGAFSHGAGGDPLEIVKMELVLRP
jgi:ribosomal protein S18 acetylase RimI-like enzyme